MPSASMQRRAALAACLFAVLPAGAQERALPPGPVRLVVGFAAGSGSDVVARVVADKLAARLNQAVVVDNKPGAAGLLAADYVSKAVPDGRTIMFSTTALSTAVALREDLRLDPLKDLTPIAALGRSSVALVVGPKSRAGSLEAFIREARSAPAADSFTYGSSGAGGSTHFFMEQFAEIAKLKLLHVPYKGAGPALTALMGAEVHVMLAPPSVAATAVASHRARVLAVTGSRRSTLVPDAPPFADAGLAEFDATIMSGFVGPANLNKAALAHLNAALNAVYQDPEFRRNLSKIDDMEIVGGSDREFATAMAAELDKLRGVARRANIKAQ